MHDSYSPMVLASFEAELVKIAVARDFPGFHEFEKVAEQVFYDWHDLPLEHQLLLFEKRANIFTEVFERMGRNVGQPIAAGLGRVRGAITGAVREGGEGIAARQARAGRRLAQMETTGRQAVSAQRLPVRGAGGALGGTPAAAPATNVAGAREAAAQRILEARRAHTLARNQASGAVPTTGFLAPGGMVTTRVNPLAVQARKADAEWAALGLRG